MLWTRAELPVWERCGVSANLSWDTIGKWRNILLINDKILLYILSGLEMR